MRTNNMSLCSTKSWVHVQSEKKEKEVRVLKYFKVKNDVMSFVYISFWFKYIFWHAVSVQGLLR